MKDQGDFFQLRKFVSSLKQGGVSSRLFSGRKEDHLPGCCQEQMLGSGSPGRDSAEADAGW